MFKKSSRSSSTPRLFFGIGAAYVVAALLIVGFVAWREYGAMNAVAGQKASLDASAALTKLGAQSGQLAGYAPSIAAGGTEGQKAAKKLKEGLNDWKTASDSAEKLLATSSAKAAWDKSEQLYKSLAQDLWSAADGSVTRQSAQKIATKQADYAAALGAVNAQLASGAAGGRALETSAMITGAGAIGVGLFATLLFFVVLGRARKSVEFDMTKYLTEREREFAERAKEASEKTMQELQAKQKEMEAQAEALEVALARAEEVNRLKTAFLANMSHEIRTPMNHVIGMAELLSQTEMSPEQRDWLRTIVSSGNQLIQLINDILDLSQVEAGKLALDPKHMNLKELVTDAVRPFEQEAKRKSIALSVWLAAETHEHLYADPVRLRQILTNLIGNAIKFTHEGRIDVSAETVATAGTMELRLSVKDTGIGIEPDRIGAVFESFTQADVGTKRTYGGTGLGLTIVKQLVDLMGGSIEVRSAPGMGSEFTVVVPVKEEAPQPRSIDAQVASGELPQLGLKTLVVEDNLVNQKVLVKLLEKLGCTVDKVDDGEAAVQKTISNTYDVILMDIHMPGKDGIEATKDIRAREKQWGRSRTPIVAVTADAMADDRQRFLDAGMDDYLAKPVRQATLIQVLNKFCKVLAA